MAVGDGAARRRRGSGLVLLRLRPRLPQGARRLSCASPAAFRCRRASPSAHGGRATGPTATRNSMQLVRGFRENRHAARRAGHRHGLAHQPASSSRQRATIDQSGQTLGWTGYTWNKLLFPDPDQFLKQHARRRPEGHAESASRLGRAAVGSSVSGDGAGHGHRSGDEEICALRHHRQEIRHELLEPPASSAGKAGHRLLVA